MQLQRSCSVAAAMAMVVLAVCVGASPASAAGTRISGGGHFVCAIKPDRTVACWGRNHSGQLGNGTLIHSSTPVTVKGLSDAVAVAAGRFHACAVLSDGSARCWGENFSGQLGNGESANLRATVRWNGAMLGPQYRGEPR